CPKLRETPTPVSGCSQVTSPIRCPQEPPLGERWRTIPWPSCQGRLSSWAAPICGCSTTATRTGVPPRLATGRPWCCRQPVGWAPDVGNPGGALIEEDLDGNWTE